MIRRHDGNDWLLIAQNDHAVLSGQLAAAIGNRQFSAPSPYESSVLGISLHDAGWTLHDEQPTLNSLGQPLHVFETPMPISARVWTASADLAERRDAYAGLLVSVHVMHLSAWVEELQKNRQGDPNYRRDVFELIRFQQIEANRQLKLRRQLGLRVDLPVQYGLMKPGVSAIEDQLIFGLRYLQLCDRLSLILCCAEDLFASIPHIHPAPGQPAIELKTRWEDHCLHVTPWPFERPALSFDVPGRRLPGRSFAGEADFRQAYCRAAGESVSVKLQAD